MKKLLTLLMLPVVLFFGFLTVFIGLFFGLLRFIKRLAIRGPSNLFKAKAQFLETLFTLIGFLSKADGRISENDIFKTESLFIQLRLKQEAKDKAKAAFKRGAQLGFDPEKTINDFTDVYGRSEAPARIMMLLLINLMVAGARLDPSETTALYRIASELNLSEVEVDQMLDASLAGSMFRNKRGSQSKKEQSQAAYRILGIKPASSKKEIKAAYKRLVSANHPDKMIAKKMPEEIIAQANIRMQEITGAYDVICSGRTFAR